MQIIDQSVEVIYPRTVEDGIWEMKHIELAGRNCWRSESKQTEESYGEFIAKLLKRRHGSPIEFGHIILKLVTSRDVMAELTRHRIASFCIESQRYVNEYTVNDPAEGAGGIRSIRPLFYIAPGTVTPDDTEHTKLREASECWYDMMDTCERYYNHLINIGMKNQDARKVLPNSTATTIMMDVNLRELLHIYELRSSPAAYPEMRELMRLAKLEIDKVLPGFLPEKEDT